MYHLELHIIIVLDIDECHLTMCLAGVLKVRHILPLVVHDNTILDIFLSLINTFF